MQVSSARPQTTFCGDKLPSDLEYVLVATKEGGNHALAATRSDDGKYCQLDGRE